MTLLHRITLTTLLFKDNYFLTFILLNNRGSYLSALNNRLSYFYCLAVSYHENIGKLYDIANLAGQFFNPQTITLCNLILFTAGTNNCVHSIPPKLKSFPVQKAPRSPKRATFNYPSLKFHTLSKTTRDSRIRKQ